MTEGAGSCQRCRPAGRVCSEFAQIAAQTTRPKNECGLAGSPPSLQKTNRATCGL